MAGKKSPRTETGASELERRFALEYLVDFDAGSAYERARHPIKVTRKTASTNGGKLLHSPAVQQLVRQARDRALSFAELDVHSVLVKLRQCLMYDARTLYTPEGKLRPMGEWPADVAAAVVGIEDTMAGRKVKLADKVAALDKAMRYFGLFEKDNRQQAEAFAEVVFKVVKADGSVA